MTDRTLTGFLLRCRGGAVTAALIAVILATGIGCDQHTSPTAPSALERARSSRSSPSQPASPMPMTNTVAAANNGVAGLYILEVAMPRSGTATVTLLWPDADFSLQLYVTSGVCASIADLVAGGCNILGQTRPGSLPGVVTSSVTGGDMSTIWVLNPDPFPQDFRVDVYIE